MNLDFFAAESDQRAVLEFLFSRTDARLFESYSLPDAELREFRSADELADAFPLGIDEHGNGNAILLRLWSPSVTPSIEVTRFSLNPAKYQGHTYRYRVDGAGLMQLYFGGICGNVVTRSHFGHSNSPRAEKLEQGGGVAWEALRKLSSKVRYHVSRRLAVAKVPGCPVLTQAMDLVRRGYEMKDSVQAPWKFEMSHVKLL